MVRGGSLGFLHRRVLHEMITERVGSCIFTTRDLKRGMILNYPTYFGGKRNKNKKNRKNRAHTPSTIEIAQYFRHNKRYPQFNFDFVKPFDLPNQKSNRISGHPQFYFSTKSPFSCEIEFDSTKRGAILCKIKHHEKCVLINMDSRREDFTPEWSVLAENGNKGIF